MEANIPFPKVQRQVPGFRNRGQDLISSLPDELICRIFSFLQIKDVLRTSILSKRWRSCWTQTSHLCIHFEEWEHDHEFFDSIEDVLMGVESSNLSFNNFHLHLFPVPTETEKMERLDNFVTFAINHRANDLHLELYKADEDEDTLEFYELPEVLLDCQTMVNLRTRRCNFSGLRENHKARWDSLRYFTIDTLELFDINMAQVCGHCPVLERLELINCFSKEHIGICSGEMRELVICGYSIADPTQWEFLYEDDGDEENEEECDNSLRISAPRLEMLRLLGTWHSKTMILLRDLSSLNEAQLGFKEPDEKEQNNVVRYIINRLLRDLCLVRRLVIERYSLQLLISRLKRGNQRLHCQYLAISNLADKKGLQQIAEILEYTPNVKKLVIELTSVNVHHEWSFIVDPYKWNVKGFGKSEAENLNCLSESLLSVVIIGFGAAHRYGLKYPLLLVRFLLRYSLVLEKMVLHTRKSWVGVNRARLKELAEIVRGYPRGSGAAKVVLRSPFDGTETVIPPQPPSHPFPFKAVPSPRVYQRRRVPKSQQGKPQP